MAFKHAQARTRTTTRKSPCTMFTVEAIYVLAHEEMPGRTREGIKCGVPERP